MKGITLKTISEIEAYDGPGAIAGLRFRAVRKALGVTAWGMNVIEFDPHTEGYPEHDHAKDGQEEVYVVLEGSLELHVAGERQRVEKGQVVRVPPNVKRKFVTSTAAASLLALGGTPGRAYEPADDY